MDNSSQRAFWTDEAGQTWVDQRQVMDQTLAPVLDAVLDWSDLRPGERVLDIGCGAGTSTFEAAERVGPTGQVRGVDISTTLLDDARQRGANLPNVDFMLCDAGTADFRDDLHDVILSRFGVMFFADTQTAFTNMAKGLKPKGRMVFATWGDIAQNPYFTMPARISKTILGDPGKTDPDAPGPLALRDIEKVTGYLRGAGLTDIEAEAIPMHLTPPGDVADVVALMCHIGPAERGLQRFQPDAATRARLHAALAEAVAPWQTKEGIRIPALINLFSARAA